MKTLNILILDDEKIIQKGLTEFLLDEEFHVLNAYTPSEAFDILKKHPVDIVLLDINLPEMSGIEVLKQIKRDYTDLEVIMITGHADLEVIVQAMRFGAFDYFYKPISLIEIKSAIERTSKYVSLNNNFNQLQDVFERLKEEYLQKMGGEIIGESPAIKEVMTLIMKAAEASDTSVLITGPSGCGKELVARTIHYLSRRKTGYLFPVNCAAVPDTLIESEFFGHIKGSFTGASEDKKGCFEIANNGTLFIDEIGDMPLNAQSKLLRVLEDRKVKKIGSSQEIPINTRIVSATNKDLDKMVESGDFRLDLYYRLNTLEIHVPSLRDRREDIPLLFDYYVKQFAVEMKKKIQSIGDDVFAVLKQYSFPGNIRELKNMAERAVILSDSDRIKLKHLPMSVFTDDVPEPPDDSSSLEDMEKQKIRDILLKYNHNISQSAKELGLSRPALYRKIEKYDI